MRRLFMPKQYINNPGKSIPHV